MEMEVRPCLAASMASCTTRSLCESRALVASSRSNNGGSRISALQMATRCFWPPESFPPRGPTPKSQPSPCTSKKLRLAMFLQASSLSSLILCPSSRP
mmetsp:Transcript_132749/g.264912  ORF Transcript_132749/g.264912 Transcript_132749/m.264912 type:complete len:98 (-) Transcript_132749:626-919(-)